MAFNLLKSAETCAMTLSHSFAHVFGTARAPPRDVADGKMRAMVQGAAIVRREVGEVQ